jgi:hypothetical protein
MKNTILILVKKIHAMEELDNLCFFLNLNNLENILVVFFHCHTHVIHSLGILHHWRRWFEIWDLLDNMIICLSMASTYNLRYL